MGLLGRERKSLQNRHARSLPFNNTKAFHSTFPKTLWNENKEKKSALNCLKVSSSCFHILLTKNNPHYVCTVLFLPQEIFQITSMLHVAGRALTGINTDSSSKSVFQLTANCNQLPYPSKAFTVMSQIHCSCPCSNVTNLSPRFSKISLYSQ